MKHIKLYEGFNNDDYYQEIDYEEWFAQRLNRLNISDTLNNRIKNLFDTNDRNIDYRIGHLSSGNQGSVRVDKMCQGILCEIKISLNDDEWYYVALEREPEDTFYKCDQFDGLKKLLKDKEIILNI